jgi:cell division protease FtsH
MSGADIANLVNEAALSAARKQKERTDMTDFDEARDKILMGTARRGLAMSAKEKEMTAFHEAGHALLHYYLPHSDPLHKVTIVPHGMALGMAVSLPEEDSYSRTRGWIEDRIAICYGGWLAEMQTYNTSTTGTKQDIKTATDMARKMVCEWGMAESDELGPITYGAEDEPIFIGKEIAQHKDYSEDTAIKIDAAIRRILDRARETAAVILKEHADGLAALAHGLLEKETLNDDEVRVILGLPARVDAAPAEAPIIASAQVKAVAS